MSHLLSIDDQSVAEHVYLLPPHPKPTFTLPSYSPCKTSFLMVGSLQQLPPQPWKSQFVDFGHLKNLSYLDLAANDTGNLSLVVQADRLRLFTAEDFKRDKFIVSIRPAIEGLDTQSVRSLRTICDLVRTGIAPNALPGLVNRSRENSE